MRVAEISFTVERFLLYHLKEMVPVALFAFIALFPVPLLNIRATNVFAEAIQIRVMRKVCVEKPLLPATRKKVQLVKSASGPKEVHQS